MPGAGTSPAPRHPVQEFIDPDQIDVGVGEPFAVVLSENAPGGYFWRAEGLPDAVRVHGEDDLAPDVFAPGATGVKRFELEVTEPGTYTLCFERRREWEPGADRTHVVTVQAAEGS